MDIRLADQGDLEVGFAVRATVAFGRSTAAAAALSKSLGLR